MKKKLGKTRPKAEDRVEEQKKETVRKAGDILARLKGQKPSLADLDEWEATEPPFPTYGGMSLEEELRKLKAKGKPNPYLP